MQAARPDGFLIAIEGIDGTGKSTLLPLLAAYVRELGYECVTGREPTDGLWGRALRASAHSGRLSLAEELRHFLEDRREHVAAVIRPALDAGHVVILDRYYLSTAAYQGVRGADPHAIVAANEAFAPRPNLILLLDAPPATGLSRVRARGDAPDEFEHRQALEEARRIFLALQLPGTVQIDASQSPAEVARQAKEAVGRNLGSKI